MVNRPQVIALRKEHPEWRLGDIGDVVGITRERVRQILRTEGLPTRQPRTLCAWCSIPIKKAHKYCSRAHRHAASLAAYTCELCGRVFFRNKKQVDKHREKFFAARWCSNQCQGTYIGQLKGHQQCRECRRTIWSRS